MHERKAFPALCSGRLQSDAETKKRGATPGRKKRKRLGTETYALTRQLLAGHRALVCHTQDTSMWAFSHSSEGRRLHQSTADVRRSLPGTAQTAASSLAVGAKSRRSGTNPTQATTRQLLLRV